MKKALLATSALAGLHLFCAGAQAADPITVTLGGTYEFYSGWTDSEEPAQPGHDFRTDPEVHINAKGTADNGLEYGIHFELETGDGGRGMRTDEAVGFVRGTFGTVEFGDEDGAAERLGIYAPTVGFGQVDSDYDSFVQNAPSNLSAAETSYFLAPDSGDSTKVTYFTPVFYGLQAGISYAAETGAANEADSVATRSSFYNSFIEGGVNYAGEFSGVGLKAGFTITDMNCSGCAGTRANLDDVTAWQLGTQISYAGFTLGGGYVDMGGVAAVPASPNGVVRNNLGAAKLEHGWNVGASYEFGPVSVAGQYATVETNVQDRDFDAYGIGVAYTVAPGLVMAGDVVVYDHDPIVINRGTSRPDDDGFVVMVGSILAF